jgi:hypothetical protein
MAVPRNPVFDAHWLMMIADGRGKFPSVKDEWPVTKGEVLAMELAKTSGLPVAEDSVAEHLDWCLTLCLTKSVWA